MNISTIIFSVIIIILIIIILILFYKLNIVNTDIINITETLNNHILSDINPDVSKEISDIKQLTLDKLKVKDIEVENSLISPNIKTDNLGAINNTININNNIKPNPKAKLIVQFDKNDNETEITLENKDKSQNLTGNNISFSYDFEEIMLNYYNYMQHIYNNELHNGKSSDKNLQIIKKDEESEETEDKIENFTDLFYY